VAAFAADTPAPAASTEAQVTLTAPLDYQVFQRAEITNGVIVVEGQWSVPPRAATIPDALVARVLSDFPAEHEACPAGSDRALDGAIMTHPGARDPVLAAKLDAVAGRVLRAGL